MLVNRGWIAQNTRTLFKTLRAFGIIDTNLSTRIHQAHSSAVIANLNILQLIKVVGPWSLFAMIAVSEKHLSLQGINFQFLLPTKLRIPCCYHFGSVG